MCRRSSFRSLPIGVPARDTSEVIPKGKSGKWRLIIDLSSPVGRSVNDGIDPEWCSMKYISVDDAAEAIRQMGRGAFLAKVDIKQAYRMVPVHRDDRPLLGMV